MTEFLGSTEVNDGYAGNTAVIYLCFDREEKKLLAVHACGYYTLQNFSLEHLQRFSTDGFAVGYFLPDYSYRLLTGKFKQLEVAQAIHARLTGLANFPLAEYGGPLFGIFGSAAID